MLIKVCNTYLKQCKLILKSWEKNNNNNSYTMNVDQFLNI